MSVSAKDEKAKLEDLTSVPLKAGGKAGMKGDGKVFLVIFFFLHARIWTAQRLLKGGRRHRRRRNVGGATKTGRTNLARHARGAP